MANSLKNIKTFNTGRPYTEEGQRIAFTRLNKSSTVAFADVDRGIFGTITVKGFLNETTILRNYDNGSYDTGLSFDRGFGYPQLRQLELAAIK